MYIYVYICIYIYIHTLYIYICIYIHTHTHTHTPPRGWRGGGSGPPSTRPTPLPAPSGVALRRTPLAAPCGPTCRGRQQYRCQYQHRKTISKQRETVVSVRPLSVLVLITVCRWYSGLQVAAWCRGTRPTPPRAPSAGARRRIPLAAPWCSVRVQDLRLKTRIGVQNLVAAVRRSSPIKLAAPCGPIGLGYRV